MNRETMRKPLEVLNLFSERNSETEAHQPTRPGYYCSDKSRIQLLNVCSTQKPYKCKFCPKLFSCSQRLEAHTKWHVKNPFQCQFCEHNYETAQGLTKHIQTHTDIRLLVCDHCNKPQKCYSFNYTRKKPRRYSCESCGRCFTLQSVLVTHLRRHIREKTFVCKFCNMTFAYSAQFRWHQNNCKQNRKTLKRDLNKKPCLQSSFPIDPARMVENVVSDKVGINSDFSTNEDVKVNISNLLCTDQIPRYNDDMKISDHFGNNRERESQGNTEVPFANQHLFDMDKDVKKDKSIISSIIIPEHLLGDHDSKNSVSHIQKTDSYSNLPKMNESCLSNVNFPPFDLFQTDGNLRTSVVQYPETSGQEEPDLIGETIESTSKTQDLFKCTHCSRTFFFQESLDKHLKRYNKTKKHTCEYCGQTFTMSGILNAHIRKHTGEMPFKCDLCQMSFTYSTQLHRHRKICNMSVRRLQAGEMAATDTISVTGESSLRTSNGSKSSNIGSRTVYPSSNNSYDHGISSTCGSLGEAELNNLAGMFYPTNSVPATSRQPALDILSPELRLSTHLTNVKENENYDFNMPRKTTAKTLLSAQEENSLHNRAVKINLTPPKSIKDPLPFPGLSSQPPEIHLQMPLPLSTYDVPPVRTVLLPAIPAQNPTRSKSRRNNASKSNGNNEKRFQCRSCGKSFSLAHNLKQHVRTHTGERPFKCDFCQARFSKSSILIVHLRRHTGEKPYGCKNCRRMFTHLTQLHRHLKVCRATGTDDTYPADLLTPDIMTTVISLGPNSFKKLTVPKLITSFVNMDRNRTNQNSEGTDDESIRKDNEKKDNYSVNNESNYAAKSSTSSTSSAVGGLDFMPQLLQSEHNSNYPVILDTEGNQYMKSEVNTFSC